MERASPLAAPPGERVWFDIVVTNQRQGIVMKTNSPVRPTWFSRLINQPRSRRRASQRTGPPVRSRPRLEALEDRLAPATTITINGTVTLDESPGLQNTGSPVGAEDNNDSDVPLTTLQNSVDPDAAAFYNRLLALGF